MICCEYALFCPFFGVKKIIDHRTENLENIGNHNVQWSIWEKKLSMYMRRRIWDSVFDISVGVYFLFGVYFVLGVCKFCIWEGVFGI